MPPTVHHHATGIRVHGAEQRFDCIVQSDDPGGGSQNFQVFGNETHPRLFARADQDDGAKKQNQIALEAQEPAELARRVSQHSCLILLRLIRERRIGTWGFFSGMRLVSFLSRLRWAWARHWERIPSGRGFGGRTRIRWP